MTEKRSDKWISLTLSVLVHGTIVGLLVWGFLFYKQDKSPEPQLAIQATVVDSSTLPAETMKTPTPPAPTPAPTPAPQPPPPEPKAEPKEEPPPPPPPEDTARKEEERKEQERKAEQQRVTAEKDRAEKARVDEERVRQEADRVARDKAERDKAEKEKADQVALQRAADEKLRAQRESELRSQLAAEERVNAARSSGLMQQYLAQIRGRIERAWIRPSSARPGLSCDVRITQVQGGEVTGVQVLSCNGDDAVRQSIEAAAYRASPLPAAPDPALFDRNLVVTFRPED